MRRAARGSLQDHTLVACDTVSRGTEAVGYSVGRPWPSPRGRRRRHGATSGAPRTRSRRRVSTPVRSAARRSARTASARPAAPTRAARSSRSNSAPRRDVARVAVDALGGDRAPGEVIAGAVDAAGDGIHVTLYGPPELDAQGLPLVDAPDSIEMADKPAEAVRAKPGSSLVAAVRAVASGDADAVVSAGNTGAMLAAGLLHLRRLPGVLRPAIAVPIPARLGPSVLLDAGANADAKPENLLQFARMGAIFSREILDVPRPRVRLLSIGEEDEKGNALTLEANALLREARDLDFAGNAESRELLRGAADVIVTDSFTGNIVLKLLEGTIKELLDEMRSEIYATLRG